FYFFFSSRRRHTRFSRDWSSDVCSSDLKLQALCVEDAPGYSTSDHMARDRKVRVTWVDLPESDPRDGTLREIARSAGAAIVRREIGRASCRNECRDRWVTVHRKQNNTI